MVAAALEAPAIVADERTFRPQRLAEFIGQTALKAGLQVMLDSAKIRQAAMEHVCFYGGPGLGKTTLAGIIAAEMGGHLKELAAPAVQKPGDLVSVLTTLQAGDVLFMDEIHALRREMAEILYGAMEDFKVAIMNQEGKEILRLALPRFTLVGATTDFGLLPEPFQARFGEKFPLELYTQAELEQVVQRAITALGALTEPAAVSLMARRARGTPRVALRLVRRCYDLSVVRAEEMWPSLVTEALDILGIDDLGLDPTDRRYIKALAEVYGGGPVGARALAASAGIDPTTLERVVEPWLMRSGLLARTRQGRQLTRAGWTHAAAFIPGLPVFPVRPVEDAAEEDAD